MRTRTRKRKRKKKRKRKRKRRRRRRRRRKRDAAAGQDTRPRSCYIYFRRCTFAATLNLSPFRRIKPVASSWLYALVGSASIVAMAGLYRLTGDFRPATIRLPL